MIGLKFKAWDKRESCWWDFDKQRSGADSDGYLVIDGNGSVLMAEIGGLRDVSERFDIEVEVGER